MSEGNIKSSGDARLGLVQRLVSPRYRDHFGGLLLVVIGLWAAFQGLGYDVGTLRQMGPGFFPTALGILLALTGVVLFGTAIAANVRLKLTGAQNELENQPRFSPEWRGWICICLSVAAFAFLAEYTGLVPATFACVFIAGLGDRENSLRDLLLLSVGISIAAVVVFWWGLGVVLPLFSKGFM
ncbi:MAG TPA: tripartite tricarboxylate transporter TctB family protein [Arsenicitalea sp.]|nr:tripartite tricarboxylate transporter TctB family protein [Arsenicitalea sp.]